MTNFAGTETRKYRGTLAQTHRAVEHWNSLDLKFVANLGDLIDGQNAGGYGAGWRRMAARRGEPADGNWEPANNKAEFTTGERVFHQKFGMGNILTIDGDKLLIAFDKAGHKKVVSGFVSKP